MNSLLPPLRTAALLFLLIPLLPVGAIAAETNAAPDRAQIAQFTLDEAIKIEADRLLQQGFQQYQTSQFQQALQSYQQALSLYRRIGDRGSEGVTLNNIGLVYQNLGQYPQALEQFQQALAITKEVGDQTGEGRTLNNIGEIYQSLEQYPQALEQFQQALAIVREVGDRTDEETVLINIEAVNERLGLSPPSAPPSASSGQTYREKDGLFEISFPEGYSYEETGSGIAFVSGDKGFGGSVDFGSAQGTRLSNYQLERALKQEYETRLQDIHWQETRLQPDGSVRIDWVGKDPSGNQLDAVSFVEQRGDYVFILNLFGVNKAYQDYNSDAEKIAGSYRVRQDSLNDDRISQCNQLIDIANEAVSNVQAVTQSATPDNQEAMLQIAETADRATSEMGSMRFTDNTLQEFQNRFLTMYVETSRATRDLVAAAQIRDADAAQ